MLVNNKFLFISLPRCASTSFYISCLRNGFDIKHFDQKFIDSAKDYINLNLDNEKLADKMSHTHEKINNLIEKFGNELFENYYRCNGNGHSGNSGFMGFNNSTMKLFESTKDFEWLLNAFTYKINATGTISFSAPNGLKDDCVMSLMLANEARTKLAFSTSKLYIGDRNKQQIYQ
mgnify:CR=1 FL=1